MAALFTVVVVTLSSVVRAKDHQPTGAEWRRWETNNRCQGDYSVIDNDPLDTCWPKSIPAPASIKIEQVNETMYANYHYNGVQDCTGDTRKHLSDFSVGVCDDFGDYSQMRVWVYDQTTITTTTTSTPDTVKPVAAEWRRWETNNMCQGDYNVTDNDPLDTCWPKSIPGSASIKVEQINSTMYANYHYDGVNDCTGNTRKHLMDFTVGVCDDFGDYSQMRVWVYDITSTTTTTTTSTPDTPQPVAAEWRRWETNNSCQGDYNVIDNDPLDTCWPKSIPAPASLKVEQINATMYANYHYDGVKDCTGDSRKHLMDFTVGICDNLGDYSQMRVWVFASDVVV